MAQKYTIEWCEVKKEGNTNGRAWKITEMTLKDEQGVVYEKVNTFDAVMPGQELEGFIEEVEKNGYKNKNFKKALEKPNFLKRGEEVSKSVEKAQARTEKSIEKTMDRKEEAIKLASAQRDAVLIVTQFYGMGTDGDKGIEQRIIKWRNWFLNDEEFNNPPPFGL